jgi:FixJ family two-component response regulator
MSRAASPGPVVYVVDDDPDVCASLCLLLEAEDHDVCTCGSAVSLLEAYDDRWTGCLLLDVRMPGMSGLELQHELRRRGMMMPIIFLTGHGDVPMASRAFRSAALDFIEKPFREEVLLERIDDALKRDAAERTAREVASRERKCYERLTPREKEVFALVVAGKSNQQIARLLGISPRMIDVHRARVMEKLGVHTLPDLVIKAAKCGIRWAFRKGPNARFALQSGRGVSRTT